MHRLKNKIIEEYWIKKLSGEWSGISLPFRGQVPPGETDPDRKSHGLAIPSAAAARLRQLANHSDIALFILLLSSFTILLNRYTGQEDLVVGTRGLSASAPPAPGSPPQNPDTGILFCRTRLAGDMNYKTIVTRTRQVVLEALNYPLADAGVVVEALRIRNEGRAPEIYGAAFIYEKIQERAGLEAFDLVVRLGERHPDRMLQVEIDYNGAVYREDLIRGVAGNFIALCDNLTQAPDRPLSRISSLAEEEKERLLFAFNRTAHSYRDGETDLAALPVHGLFERQARLVPHRVALEHRDRQLTYREAEYRSRQLARVLRTRGASRGTIVGIMAEPSLAMVVGILAILKAGAAYLPIEPAYPQQRIITMLRDSSASLLLVQDSRDENRQRHSFTALQGLGGIGPRQEDPEIQVTGPRPQITDFAALPVPDRSLVNYEAYHRFIGLTMFKNTITLQATRGCPYHCAYCHKIWPKTHVVRPAARIFQEVSLYYRLGVRRFSFIDDIFNLDQANSAEFFRLILREGLKVQLFFPNGFRGDLLTREYIDLAVAAGTVNIALSLETASPRLQKLIRKNLDLEKLRENLQYICDRYPGVISELQLMHGFPTETAAEARMTLDFVKSLKWIHFPYLHILKIYPFTDMARLAVEKGISSATIEASSALAFHELPDTLPFDKNFTLTCQTEFLNQYFLSRERLLHLLPYQLQVLGRDELVQKYNSYLPVRVTCLADLLEFAGIREEELKVDTGNDRADEFGRVPDINQRLKRVFPRPAPSPGALRVLLLDLSQFYSSENEMLYDVVEPPLGLLYLLTYLNREFGGRLEGKIAKSRVDFDSDEELKVLIEEFQPQVIGIRTLTFYKDFFHRTAAAIRQWGIRAPLILGGPYATSDYRSLLRDRNIDLAVLGEGELTFSELIARILDNGGMLPGREVLKEIKGIAFRTDCRGVPRDPVRQVLLLDAYWKPEPLPAPASGSGPMDPAYVIFTSGSAGRPKGVMVPHRALVNLCGWHNRYYRVTHRDRAAKYAGFGFDASVWEIFPYLAGGAALCLVDNEMKPDLRRLNRFFQQRHITIAFLPTQVCQQFMMMENRSLRVLLTGGDRLKRFIQQDYRLYNNYGPTEDTVVALAFPVDAEVENIPLGAPIDNNRVYIVDKSRHQLQPIGAAGELCLGGKSLALGYLNRVELTAGAFLTCPNKKFCGGPGKHGGGFSKEPPGQRGLIQYRERRLYCTGDLGRWLPEGNIQFLGRIDHQVKIRGSRIELGEVERRLLKHEGVREALVLCRQDSNAPSGDPYLCAYIVTPQPLEESTLKDYLARYLPDYMVPLYFVTLERMPVTPNGKIDRKALPEPIPLKRESNYRPPRDRWEEELVELWSEVLGVGKEFIGRESNFFELGGHSLKMTQLIARLHQRFQVKPAMEQIFKTPTISGFIQQIKTASRQRCSAIAPSEKREYYPLSAEQQRLYVLQQMEREPVSYNIPIITRLEGVVDISGLERAFNKLVRRHESLRTSFRLVEGEPVQRVHDDAVLELEYVEPGPGGLEPDPPSPVISRFIRPFDLGHPPLLRVGLIKLRETRHILMVDLHHIITDGVSMGIFFREFTEVYRDEELPPLGLQYRDYSRWQQHRLTAGEFNTQENYWLRDLAGYVPGNTLPLDFKRPSFLDSNGSREFFHLAAGEFEALKTLAREQGTTLYILLLTLFTLFLARLSGREDVVVGTPIAGRGHADLQSIIGVFVNMLALRNYPRGKKTLRQFLQEVNQRTLQAFENREYQFDRLAEKIEPRKDSARHPVFNEVFSFNLPEIPTLEMDGLTFVPLRNDNFRAKFDLMLFVSEEKASASFSFEYRTRLFKKETILDYIDYFKKIVSAVIREKDVRLEEVAVSPAGMTSNPQVSSREYSDFGF